MNKIGKHHFPTTMDEAKEWKPIIKVQRLAPRVLVVGKTRIEGAWNAYIDSVPGMNHDKEWRVVLEYGHKLPEEVAKAIFPHDFNDLPYAW
jgi:hypothetical protein